MSSPWGRLVLCMLIIFVACEWKDEKINKETNFYEYAWANFI